MTVKKECKREVGLTKECLRPIGHSFHEWIDDTRNHRANAKHYAAISLRNSFNTGLSVYLYLHMHTHTHTHSISNSQSQKHLRIKQNTLCLMSPPPPTQRTLMQWFSSYSHISL